MPLSVTGESATDWKRTLQLPAFDETWGTLTQVKLTLTSAVRQELKLENLGASEGRFSYRLTTTLALSARPPMGSMTLYTASSGGQSLGAFDGSRDFSGGSGFNFSRTNTGTETRVESSAAALAGFSGKGSLDFLVTATALSVIEGAGNWSRQAASWASVSAELEYTFTPIPEPDFYATLLGLLGLGLVLVGRARMPTEAAGANLPRE